MMIHKPTLLPYNWIELVNNFDTNRIITSEGQVIAEKIKGFILEKQQTIIGSSLIQTFLSAVISEKYDIYQDYHSMPKTIIDEAFSEIKGEVGLRFCEKFDSVLIELIAFRDVLQSNGFVSIEKEREEGKSDFFIKKYCLEYEAEVKFKMPDQAFHDSITKLVMGQSMFPNTHCLVGKRVVIKIKLLPSDIKHMNKARVYKTVEQWCQNIQGNFSDDDIDIVIKNGTERYLQIECADSSRLGCVPEPNEVATILKSHMQTIQKQFIKRKPKRSIGIIVWETPWNYNFEEAAKMEESIVNGVREGVDDVGLTCDRLYIYPTGFKRSLCFKSKRGKFQWQHT